MRAMCVSVCVWGGVDVGGFGCACACARARVLEGGVEDGLFVHSNASIVHTRTSTTMTNPLALDRDNPKLAGVGGSFSYLSHR